MKLILKTLTISLVGMFLTTMIGNAESGRTKINITQAKAVYATPFSISISGLKPGEKVKISSSSIDKGLVEWRATASFKADKKGMVDLKEQKPVSGYYNEADVYGLLWSMKPVNSKREETFYNYDTDTGLTIKFKVTDSEGNITEAEIFRYYEDPDNPLFSIKLDENGLKGTLYSPDNKKRYPGVILLSGSNGGSVNWLAKAIAAHGFSVLDIPYFKYPGLPDKMVNIPLEYFYKAVKWIQKQSTVKGGKIGMIGGSRGGELALQLASMFDEFKAVVAWVPAAHLWQGEDYEKLVPSWTWKGKPLPYIGEEFSKEDMQKLYTGQITSFRDYFLSTLKNLDKDLINDASIKVEDIKAPLLLVSGEDDQTWPASIFSEMVMTRLKKHDYKYDHRHLSIKNTGHHVFLPDFITATYRHFNGGTREDELHGSIRSWDETIKFLHKYLDN